jgi:chemotaxis methyl-accepting protein methylase
MTEAIIALSRRLAVWTGLDLERGVHAHILHDVLSRRATAMGTTIDAYASALQAAHSPEAMRIIDFVTVCHSWFFRDREQLSGVERLIVDATSDLNIWLAGCASGEEAYTIAMLADARGRRPYILGTDINTEALARARAGRYGPWSLKDLPTAYADRFSRRADATCELVPRVRLAVELLRHNLMEPPPAPRSSRGWDVILCRNVLMYFRPVDAAATITRLRNALRPGGYSRKRHMACGSSRSAVAMCCSVRSTTTSKSRDGSPPNPVGRHLRRKMQLRSPGPASPRRKHRRASSCPCSRNPSTMR